jgi:hypothetical protein
MVKRDSTPSLPQPLPPEVLHRSRENWAKDRRRSAQAGRQRLGSFMVRLGFVVGFLSITDPKAGAGPIALAHASPKPLRHSPNPEWLSSPFEQGRRR